jgi:hypothetical protein
VVRLAIHLVLATLIAVSFVVNATLDDPEPDNVPTYEALVPHIGEGTLSFLTDSSEMAPYRFRAFRYAIAPRIARLERRRSRSDWVVSDRAGVPPGYTVVRRQNPNVVLLRRQ